MRRATATLSFSLVCFLLAVGCGKKDEETKQAPKKGTPSGQAKPGTSAPKDKAEPPATPPVEKGPAKEAAGAKVQSEAAGKQAIAFLQKVADTATKHQGNCDEMAGAMQKLIDSSQADVEMVNKIDMDWLEKTFDKQLEAVMTKLMGPMQACESNEKLKELFSKALPR